LTKATSGYKKNTAFPYSCTIYRQVVKPAKTNDGFKENQMSKLIRGCFALVLILMFSTPADCKELTTYLSCNLGLAMLEDSDLADTTLPGTIFNFEFDPGYFVGLAFGNHVDNLRFEAELGYQKNKVDTVKVNGVSTTSSGDQEIRLSTLMFNLYYDFKNRSAFTPYLSAGLGLGNLKLDGASKGDSVAAYQYGAGMAYQISDRVALDLKVRHLETSDGEFDTSNLDFSTNNAIFDVRIYF
jgi:outer membrane immunogenic protein